MKKSILYYLTGIGVAMFIFVTCDKPRAVTSTAPTFLETLDVHLNAIQASNLEKLEPTVGPDVAMIGPDGKKHDSKEVFMNFHKAWFATKNWEWKGKILRTESSDSLGYALIQYEYIQKDTTGSEVFRDNEYLVLVFKNSGRGWELVHDQNTSIK